MAYSVEAAAKLVAATYIHNQTYYRPSFRSWLASPRSTLKKGTVERGIQRAASGLYELFKTARDVEFSVQKVLKRVDASAFGEAETEAFEQAKQLVCEL